MQRRYAAWGAVGVVALVVVFLWSSSTRALRVDERDAVFDEYLLVRNDLGDDVFIQRALDAERQTATRDEVRSCVANAGVILDWARWWTGASSYPDNGVLDNPLGGSSDLFRPLDSDEVRRLGMGWERAALDRGVEMALLSELLDGSTSDVELVQVCFASTTWVDLRPAHVIEIDTTFTEWLQVVHQRIDEDVYGPCMEMAGHDIPTSGEFAELTSFLVEDYLSAWSDAPLDGRSDEPAWRLVREHEVELSLDDAECRSEMIGDSWKELKSVLDDFDTQFGDEREGLRSMWEDRIAR